MDEAVECHSGSAYDERPAALKWEGQRLMITTIEAQWLTPGEKVFRVLSEDGRRFELKYDMVTDEWQVKLL